VNAPERPLSSACSTALFLARYCELARFERPGSQRLDHRVGARSSASFRSEGSTRSSIPTGLSTRIKSLRTKKRRRAALLQSPLPDSNRRPPPYHAIQTAAAGSPGQQFGASSSHFLAFGEPNVCHRLRPPLFHNCSIPIGPKTRALARATIGGGGDDPSVIGRGPPATGGSPRTDARSRYLESDRFRASGLRSQAGPRRRAS
jgi:hypothetical protein